MEELQIVWLPPGDLIPYAKNAKKHDSRQISNVANSIRRFGWKQPIVIDDNNVVVIGHCRLLAAKKLGQKRVPCIYASGLTDEEIRELRIADNKTNESEWDLDLLADDIQGLTFEGFEGFDFESLLQKNAEEQIDAIQEDDYDGEVPEEPISKRGDIYQLGNHRVMCGDSTSTADMDALLQGAQPLFVFTDPPYGVAIGDKNKLIQEVTGGSTGIKQNIIGDTMGERELHDMLTLAMQNLRKHCADDCAYYVSAPQGGSLGMMMLEMMRDAGLEVRHNLVWVKNAATFSIGRLDYDYRHEPIFYTWTKSHHFYGDYSNTVIEDDKPIDKMSKSELKDVLRAYLQKGETSVIYCDKPLQSKLHPTMKPVKLVGRFMVNSSREGDPVIDIFGGSGTTLIAAEQLGRKAFLMELDPHYVDVIVARWESFRELHRQEGGVSDKGCNGWRMTKRGSRLISILISTLISQISISSPR